MFWVAKTDNKRNNRNESFCQLIDWFTQDGTLSLEFGIIMYKKLQYYMAIYEKGQYDLAFKKRVLETAAIYGASLPSRIRRSRSHNPTNNNNPRKINTNYNGASTSANTNRYNNDRNEIEEGSVVAIVPYEEAILETAQHINYWLHKLHTDEEPNIPQYCIENFRYTDKPLIGCRIGMVTHRTGDIKNSILSVIRDRQKEIEMAIQMGDHYVDDGLYILDVDQVKTNFAEKVKRFYGSHVYNSGGNDFHEDYIKNEQLALEYIHYDANPLGASRAGEFYRKERLKKLIEWVMEEAVRRLTPFTKD
ncbi:hypothetical protein H4219_003758 [Mycoemilia scoparia]|uniref:Uncharacterized protein n=1 Tax=Mycoemilia scoparia TaxID=417184 RepID=A0A9W8A0D4_9FUNG|nr:hypothetical protein H4219_003758 [Mycoemilia scoparia]